MLQQFWLAKRYGYLIKYKQKYDIYHFTVLCWLAIRKQMKLHVMNPVC